MASALSFDSNFKGSFFSVATYGPKEAQNPILALEGAGVIGLPLTEPESIRVERSCYRTSAETNAPWIMDAAKVRPTFLCAPVRLKVGHPLQISFRNPEWDSFLSNVVREACVTLGVPHDAGTLRWELKAFELYGDRCW